MATRRGSSVAELKRLGGADSALKIVESGTSSDSRESAALVLANASQADDEVCKQVLLLPGGILASLVTHLKSTNTIIKKSVARTIANCTAAEYDEAGPDAAEVLRKAGAVPALLDVIPTRDLPLMQSVTSSLDNLCADSAACCTEVTDCGGLDSLVSVLARPEWPVDDIVNESIASCLCSLVASSERSASIAADNGALRCMYEVVRPFAESVVQKRDFEASGESVDDPATPQQREATVVEELAFTMITNSLNLSPLAVFSLYKLDPTFSLLRNMLASAAEEMQVQAICAIERCANAAVSGPDDLGVPSSEAEEKKGDPEARQSGSASADAEAIDSAAVSGGAGGVVEASSGKGFAGPTFRQSLAADAAARERQDSRLPREQVLEAVFSHVSVTLTWLLDHTDDTVATTARRTFSLLRRAAGEGGTVSASSMRPFLGSGVVPVLQTLTGSENESTATYCDECLAWLKEACTPELVHDIKSDIATTESLELRTALAVALTYLCFDAPHVQKEFLTEDGLGNVLRMLGLPSKRPAAINYLLAIQPIIDGGEDESDEDETLPPTAGPWSEAHVNVEEDSDLTLLMGEAKKPLFVHKTVLRDHSEVVAGMRMAQRDNVEVPDVSFDTALVAMKAVYQGDLESLWTRAAAPTPAFAVDVMRLGNSLGMPVLTKFVSAWLHESVDEESIVPVFREALASADAQLCGTCVQFILEKASWLFERGDKAEPLADLLRQLITGMIED